MLSVITELLHWALIFTAASINFSHYWFPVRFQSKVCHVIYIEGKCKSNPHKDTQQHPSGTEKIHSRILLMNRLSLFRWGPCSFTIGRVGQWRARTSCRPFNPNSNESRQQAHVEEGPKKKSQSALSHILCEWDCPINRNSSFAGLTAIAAGWFRQIFHLSSLCCIVYLAKARKVQNCPKY